MRVLINEPTPVPTAIDAFVSGQALLTSFLLYGCLGLAVVILYAILRNCTRNVYAPRNNWVSKGEQVPPLPRGFVRWLGPLLHPSACDDLILRHVGLDAYMVIRVLHFGLKYFVITFVIASISLFPYYALLGDVTNLEKNQTLVSKKLDQLTMMYILGPETNSNLTWWPVVVVNIFTAIGLWLFHKEWLHFIPLQREFHSTHHNNTYTVLVERIPAELESRKALLRYFETLAPGTVRRVDLVPFNETAKALRKAVEEREDLLQSLEHDMIIEHRSREKALAAQGLSQSLSVQEDSQDRDMHVDVEPVEGAQNERWRRRMLVFKKGQEWMGARAFCYGRIFGCFATKAPSIALKTALLEEANELVASLQDQLKREAYVEQDQKYSGPSEGEKAEDDKDGSEFDEYISDDDEEAGARWSFNVDEHGREAEWLLRGRDYQSSTLGGIEAAFVTFSTKASSTSIARGMRSETNHFSISTAPEPRDIKWGGMACNPMVILAARLGVFIFLILLLAAFGSLVGFLSLTTNIEYMRDNWQWLDDQLEATPFLVNIWEQVGPLVLVICFAIVPPILNLILELRFFTSESEKESSFFIHYYAFLVVQIFLFFQISGAVGTLLAIGWKNPKEFLAILALTVPNNATFFMQYICIKAFWVVPTNLIRLADMALSFLVRPIFCRPALTPRELHDDTCGCRAFVNPGDAWHGLQLGSMMLILTIGITYSVLAPLVLLFSGIYFAFSLIVWRNQFLYVYCKQWEGGGAMFSKVGGCIIFTFLLFQFTMLALFGIKALPGQSLSMLFPIFVTVVYAGFLSSNYDSQHLFVTLSDARKLDIQSLRNKGADTEPLDYRVPGLKAPERVSPTPVPEMLAELDRLHGVQENKDPFQDDENHEYLQVPNLFAASEEEDRGDMGDNAPAANRGNDVVAS